MAGSLRLRYPHVKKPHVLRRPRKIARVDQEALGKEWSPQLQLREEHHLVTTGPYARVRHPIYTAMFGYGTSLALVTANWVFLGLAVLVIGGLIARVPKEEQMMLEEFGEEYKAYIKNTGRFFPK